MMAATALATIALLLGLAALLELGRDRPSGESERRALGGGGHWGLQERLARAASRLGLSARLARAGWADRVGVRALLAAKVAGAIAGALWAVVAAPAAPDRLSWIVALRLPAAGFLAPDAWLERCARQRLRSLRASMPDALDLLPAGTAAGRSPLAGLAELGTGDGPLARELAVLAAESSCGAPQREALESLHRRAPVREVAAMCGVIERSRRYGSPLAEQLQEQATALRAVQRRRVEEQAARAAPKIQLAVALLLVPSVLLMIAAGLLANVDRFLAGF